MNKLNERFCKDYDKTKPIDNFTGKWVKAKRKSFKWSGAHYCKDCMRKRSRDHYHSSRNQNILTARKFGNKRKIYEYLLSHPCVDCGENNPVVLEFDHVRDKKSFNMSSATVKGYTWDLIENEIKKCDIRCANCHKMKTAKEQNWQTYEWHFGMEEV